MTDTEIVPRKRDREPADRPPLVEAELADELLAQRRLVSARDSAD